MKLKEFVRARGGHGLVVAGIDLKSNVVIKRAIWHKNKRDLADIKEERHLLFGSHDYWYCAYGTPEHGYIAYDDEISEGTEYCYDNIKYCGYYGKNAIFDFDKGGNVETIFNYATERALSDCADDMRLLAVVTCPFTDKNERRAYVQRLHPYMNEICLDGEKKVYAVNEITAAVTAAGGSDGRSVLVVDMGARGLRVSVVRNGELIKTYERPLGGNMVDEALLKCIEKDTGNLKFDYYNHARWALRLAKEHCFDENGDTKFETELDNGETISVEITKELLNSAMHDIKIRVPGTINSDPITPDRVYSSVVEAYAGELSSIKKEIEHDMGEGFKADLVVPMGGAWAIKELSDITDSVFGESAKAAVDPKNVVAEGLLLIGRNLLRGIF